MKRLNINVAIELLHNIFWPEFVELDGCIFLAWTNPHNMTDETLKFDNTGKEATWNHTHMEDLFKHKAGLQPINMDDPCYFDSEHPDFLLLCEMGKALAQMWYLKLRNDFPYYDFRVYYTEKDNPIVRFHRVWPDEHVWLDESHWSEAIESGEIIIYDTRTDRDD